MEFFIVYGLVIISLLITLGAQAFVSTSYSKYSKINNMKGLTGSEVARLILDKHGLQDVKVVSTSGNLSDHYDPKSKVVRLSTGIYEKSTVASVAVACHECGHAIQHKEGYTFLRIRSSMVPFVNFCSYAGYLAILIGSIFSAFGLIWAGIFAEVVILLFQLITLPVEFDASSRALKKIEEYGIVTKEELKYCKKMLRSAALTYVAGVTASFLQVLRLVLMYRRND